MKKNILKKHYPIFFIIILGTLLAIGFSLLLAYREKVRRNEYFKHDSMERIKNIEESIRHNIMALKTLRDFYNASTIVTRKDFNIFTADFLLDLPGIKAFEWVPKVSLEELDNYIQMAKVDGHKDFMLTQLNMENEQVPVTEREFYYPVYYVNPLEGNEAVLGFDLASNPPRQEALLKATRENKPVATAPIKLVQAPNNSPGFLLIIPVYRKDKIEPVKGFVIAVLEFEAIINESLTRLKPLGIDITLIDKTVQDEEITLYNHLSRLTKSGNSYTTIPANKRVDSDALRQNINVGGRTWQIITYPTTNYIQSKRTALPWISGLSIFLLTITIALYVKRVMEAKEQIKHLVEKKTKELNESKTRLDLAIEGAELGLWDWHIQSGDVFFNERWAAMLGYRLDEIVPHVDSWAELLHPDDKETVYSELNAYLEGRAPFYKTKHRLKTKSGGWKWVLDTGKIVERDAENRPLRATGIHLDITESKEYEKKLERLTITDSLTQLYNRLKIHEELHKEIERAVRYNAALSLIMFDIDHFKSINDNYGHDVGDEVLIMVSDQVKNNIRQSDLLARWGGEEFMILAPNTTLEMAARLAEKLRLILEKSYSTSHKCVTASFGVTEFSPEDSFDSFTKRVDDALYRAKREGRNRVVTLIGQK